MIESLKYWYPLICAGTPISWITFVTIISKRYFSSWCSSSSLINFSWSDRSFPFFIWRIFLINEVRSKGFSITYSAPNPIASSITSSCPNAVKIINAGFFKLLSSLFISSRTFNPSILGIMISNSTTSGWLVLIIDKVSRPSEALPTSVISFSLEIISCKFWRICSLSSAIATLIFDI